MGQQSQDVESLQKSDRRRGSCLDIFLVVSVVSLFMALAALTVGGLMVVMEMQSELKTLRKQREFETPSLGTAALQADKMQNYAYLEAISVELRNSTMGWNDFSHGSWESVGNNVEFDKTQYSLKLKQEGTYLMFIDLKVTCTSTCKAGLLTVHVGDKLTCKVQLPANPVVPVSRKCWTVSRLSDEKLFAQMTVSQGEMNNWKLESNGSGFGVFLVN